VFFEQVRSSAKIRGNKTIKTRIHMMVKFFRKKKKKQQPTKKKSKKRPKENDMRMREKDYRSMPFRSTNNKIDKSIENVSTKMDRELLFN
jgi:hypothetical protein